MTIEEIASISAPLTGYLHVPIRKMNDSGKVNPELEDFRIQKILEEDRRKIQPIYNSKGKIIEYYKY